MKNSNNNIQNKARLGWVIFAVSLVIIFSGLGIRFFSPELA
jgi:hypothetical protein